MEFDLKAFYVEDLSPTHYSALKLKEIIFEGKSEYQSIRVLDTHDYGKILVLDDTIQAAEIDEYIYHEVLVHPPLMLLEDPYSVLVVGGGDGGLIEEVVKHLEVKQIDMVEIDRVVVDVSRKYLTSICGNAFQDPRVKLIIDDGRDYIKKASKEYDLVILDLTDPIGPSKALYTKDFYIEITKILRPEGIVATHCGGWFNYPKVSSTIFNTFSSVFEHVISFPCLIPSYGMELAFIYASQRFDFRSITSEVFMELSKKFVSKNNLKYVSADFFHEMKGQSRVFQKHISSSDRVSTDKNPFEFQDFYPWETLSL